MNGIKEERILRIFFPAYLQQEWKEISQNPYRSKSKQPIKCSENLFEKDGMIGKKRFCDRCDDPESGEHSSKHLKTVMSHRIKSKVHPKREEKEPSKSEPAFKIPWRWEMLLKKISRKTGIKYRFAMLFFLKRGKKKGEIRNRSSKFLTYHKLLAMGK